MDPRITRKTRILLWRAHAPRVPFSAPPRKNLFLPQLRRCTLSRDPAVVTVPEMIISGGFLGPAFELEHDAFDVVVVRNSFCLPKQSITLVSFYGNGSRDNA